MCRTWLNTGQLRYCFDFHAVIVLITPFSRLRLLRPGLLWPLRPGECLTPTVWNIVQMLKLFLISGRSEREIMVVNCYQAGWPGFYASQPSVSSTLLLNGWVSSWVVVRRCLLEFFLTCVSFDPWWSLSVHLIKPTFNPQFRGIVNVSLCSCTEDVEVLLEVPGWPA